MPLRAGLWMSLCLAVHPSTRLSKQNFEDMVHSNPPHPPFLQCTYFFHSFLMFPWSNLGFPSTNFTQHSFHKHYDPDGSFRQYRLNTSLTVFSRSECARRPQNDYIWISYDGFTLLSLLYYWYWLICYDSLLAVLGYFLLLQLKHASLFFL